MGESQDERRKRGSIFYVPNNVSSILDNIQTIENLPRKIDAWDRLAEHAQVGIAVENFAGRMGLVPTPPKKKRRS